MKHILITGSNGQLGNEIKQISTKHNELNFIFTDIEELDITDPLEVDKFLNNHPIDYIVNCAAYTAVDKAESDEDNARLLNSFAVKNLVQSAGKKNIKLIHISTDYVFDGCSNKPYQESDQTNPQSVYGYTKLEGENYITQSKLNASIIRTSWLYSSFGGNFVKTILRLAKKKEELNVVHDQFGSPTYAADLANAIIKIVCSNQFVPGIFHYTNDGICSWNEFANEIISIKNISCRINQIETIDYPTDAKRPIYSVLDKSKIIKTYHIIIPHWKESLKKCLEILD